MASKKKSDAKPEWLAHLKKMLRDTCRPGKFHESKTRYKRKGRRISKLGKDEDSSL